jgi:Capsid protein (F protein).
MMNRETYDLSHYAHLAGKLGRLQTITVHPVVAGDSLEISASGIIRLAPLRKEVVSESQVDICAFYVPHRHIYDDWNTYIQVGRQPIDGGVALTDNAFATSAGARDLSYLTLDYAAATIPRYVIQGYNQIWDRYFRVPSLPRDATELTYPNTDSADHQDWRKYGRRCSRLPHPVNDGIRIDDGALTDQPWRELTNANAQVATSAGDLDIRSLAYVQAQYEMELETAFFTEFYKDVLEKRWGTSVNIDADQRPEFLFRKTFMMSGHDVDGADDASLGQVIGKTVAEVNFNMPRKFFNEHGAVWVVALVRHPFVHVGEINSLVYDAQEQNTNLFMANPSMVQNTPPASYRVADWLAPPWGSSTISVTEVKPYGQQYRLKQNRVHKNYADIEGYPFLAQVINDLESASYYQTGDYDDIFQTSQLGHWQAHLKIGMQSHRVVAPASSSVFTGTR